MVIKSNTFNGAIQANNTFQIISLDKTYYQEKKISF